jgi:hypothetical protein
LLYTEFYFIFVLFSLGKNGGSVVPKFAQFFWELALVCLRSEGGKYFGL